MVNTRTRNPPKRTTGNKKQPTALDLVDEAARLRDAGDYARAEEMCRRAVRLDPGCSDAWAELGCVAMESSRFGEAYGWFRRVLQIMQPAARGPRTGAEPAEPRKTLLLLEQVLAAAPHWPRGHYALGFALEQLGDRERARTHLTRALQLRPSFRAPVEALLAKGEMDAGNPTEAIAAADRALAADGANALAHLVRGLS